MRTAALYDIHGNLPALEAVLAAIRGEAVERIVIGGDVVPGPMPRAVMKVLLTLDVPVHFIAGNGEHDVLAAHRGEPLTRVPERYHAVLHWVARALPAEHLAAMAAWPAAERMPIEGLGEVLVCHATPRDDNELFTRVTPEERLRPLFEATGADVVLCGHTHMPFDRRIGAVRVVNPGSVGMPFGEPGAYWALLGPDVHLRRTPYDYDAAVRQMNASGYPPAGAFDAAHPPAASTMEAAFEAAALR